MAIIEKWGRKYYPCCNWENCQHKVYTEYERSLNILDEEENLTAEEINKANEWHKIVMIAMNNIDSLVIKGIAYAPFPEFKAIKAVINNYDDRNLAREINKELWGK